MEIVYSFLSGMFLANGIPHLVKGIVGQTHMTPFKRVSSPLLNVVWGFVNFWFGLFLINMSGGNFNSLIALDTYSWSFLIGALFMALADAKLFSNPNARLPWQKN